MLFTENRWLRIWGDLYSHHKFIIHDWGGGEVYLIITKYCFRNELEKFSSLPCVYAKGEDDSDDYYEQYRDASASLCFIDWLLLCFQELCAGQEI